MPPAALQLEQRLLDTAQQPVEPDRCRGSRGQLEHQWQVVEPTDDLTTSDGVPFRRPRTCQPVAEQRDGLLLRERPHRHPMLVGKTQGLTRGGQEPHLATPVQHLVDQRADLVEQVLAVVHEQEHRRLLEFLDQVIRREPQRLGDSGAHTPRTHRHQVDEPGAGGEASTDPAPHLERQGRLPRTAGTQQRHHPRG